jgi:hypothetical protein
MTLAVEVPSTKIIARAWRQHNVPLKMIAYEEIFPPDFSREI